MIRVADLVARLFRESGIDHVFMVTGGGAMHLNDAIGRDPGLKIVFCHHEQACAMAAESYGRLTGRPAAVNVTTGPGGLNALNGVFGAYVDSIPMVIVSGQVKRDTMVASYNLPLRQLGDQEVDIVAVATAVTKSATVLDDPLDARYVVERAIWTAKAGRPGPVWIDIPSDVQSALVDEDSVRHFVPSQEGSSLLEVEALSGPPLTDQLRQVLDRLVKAERPVILVGAGVRISGAHDEFIRVIDKLQVPVVTAWNAHDALWDDHPFYVGRPGTVGDRAGNFAVQNSDFLFVLGSRLNIRQVSYNWTSFARAAFTVMIDIDPAEIGKPTLSIDLPIIADLRESLEILGKDLPYESPNHHAKYLAWCLERRWRYPIEGSAEPGPGGTIDPYYFLLRLFEELAEGEVVVTGDGTACVVTFQVARLKPGQRLYTNSGCASMGYDLPAAIGAAIANGGRRVICIAGDGSLMLNLQELQTIVGNKLPIKLIVLANNGYSSIRQTQRNYFPDNIIGCDPNSGLTFPDFTRVGQAFGIWSRRCSSPSDISRALSELLEGEEPKLLEVLLDPDRAFEPKLASRILDDGTMVSSSLEDLAPFLDRGELLENMLIPLEGDDGR